MNSLGERPHSTIGNAIRSMLHSAGLELKYWNFAFYHFIRLFNFFPCGTKKNLRLNSSMVTNLTSLYFGSLVVMFTLDLLVVAPPNLTTMSSKANFLATLLL